MIEQARNRHKLANNLEKIDRRVQANNIGVKIDASNAFVQSRAKF
jgi:hypothetical protein